MMPVALVTGAGRSIGAATARLLASRGWHLVLFDRCADDPALPYPLATEAELAAVAADCGAAAGAGGVATVVGDVRRQEALDHAVAVARQRFGGLDAAVAAAGAMAGGTEAWNTSEQTWETVLAVNLEGVWRLARAAVPALLAGGDPRRGRFVAVASAGGNVGLPLLAAYSAAKHGVVGLVRSMAAELGPHQVTANVVAPGSTATPMLDATAAIYHLEGASEFAQHHLLPRLLAPEQPAAMVAWLCSEEAGGVTGAVLAVDAGMTAR